MTQTASGIIYSLVGGPGSGKGTLYSNLQTHFKDNPTITFLTDWGSTEGEPLTLVSGVNQLIKSGEYFGACPMARLTLLWARLICVIENQVKPAILAGKTVVMAGFGGTALAYALYGVESEEERALLISMHKQFIAHCVRRPVSPPVYLWLKADTDTALARFEDQHILPKHWCPRQFIEALNGHFSFYGSLPGQTVVPIDSSLSDEHVLQKALTIITH